MSVALMRGGQDHWAEMSQPNVSVAAAAAVSIMSSKVTNAMANRISCSPFALRCIICYEMQYIHVYCACGTVTHCSIILHPPSTLPPPPLQFAKDVALLLLPILSLYTYVHVSNTACLFVDCDAAAARFGFDVSTLQDFVMVPASMVLLLLLLLLLKDAH